MVSSKTILGNTVYAYLRPLTFASTDPVFLIGLTDMAKSRGVAPFLSLGSDSSVDDMTANNGLLKPSS